MVQSLWDSQVDSIIDVKLGDEDADSYKYEPMAELLARWETIKKDKPGKHFHDQRKTISSFVLSVDGILRRKALVLISKLSLVVAEKREEPVLKVRGWVNGLITIVVVRSYS